jgi:ABC-type sugar transport system ATPase subunit
MARAEFDSLSKRFGDVVALVDFTLALADGELVTVLGPSGCGKSTLLRLAAGLEQPSAGTIALDGERLDGLPPERRNVAMVFQSYALYPHLSVRGNIEFPLRMRRTDRAVRRRRAEEAASLLEIDALLDRRPAELSGGQRQRVALARALVRSPALFLLDEPLSNLDARLRSTVRRSIREVQRRLGVTTLYVTHDQTEAMTLGDRVVVMSEGRTQQVDSPIDLYTRPANRFVASFVGTPPMNLIDADYQSGELRLGDQTIVVPQAVRARIGPDRRLTVGIRPEAFVATNALHGAAGSMQVAAETDASTREILGSETLVRATIGSQPINVQLPGLVADVPSRVLAPVESLHFFDAATGSRID